MVVAGGPKLRLPPDPNLLDALTFSTGFIQSFADSNPDMGAPGEDSESPLGSQMVAMIRTVEWQLLTQVSCCQRSWFLRQLSLY